VKRSTSKLFRFEDTHFFGQNNNKKNLGNKNRGG
jgi:hypothetical protein